MLERKSRNSSIEVLKIIALFFVVLCHSIPLYKLQGSTELAGYLDLRQSTTNIQQIVLIIYSHLGQVGNALFIVPSAYFLLNSNTVKKNKIAQFVLDTFIISVIYLALFTIFDRRPPLGYVISALFPTTFNFYWFITCYILLYAIHPWLNRVIEKMSKEQLFSTNICLFLLYCCISFVLDGKYYYSQLIGFIVYYFFVAYCKLYLPNLSRSKLANIKVLLFCSLGFFATIFAANYVGVFIPAASGYVGKLETFINPFIVGIAISAFNLCNLKTYSNEIVNKISSTSLLVFVISNNQLVCSFVKPLVFEHVYQNLTYRFISAICPLIALVTLGLSVLIASAYKLTVQRLVDKCASVVISICKTIRLKTYEYLDSLESGGGGV